MNSLERVRGHFEDSIAVKKTAVDSIAENIAAAGQLMNLVTDQRTQRFVHQLVTRQRANTLELGGYDDRFEVRVVIASHLDPGIVEAGFDETGYLFGIHARDADKRKFI